MYVCMYFSSFLRDLYFLCNTCILLDNLIDFPQLCLAHRWLNKPRCLALISFWNACPIFSPANQTSLPGYSSAQVTMPQEVKHILFPLVPIFLWKCSLFLRAQGNAICSSTYFPAPPHSSSSFGLIPLNLVTSSYCVHCVNKALPLPVSPIFTAAAQAGSSNHLSY